MWPCWLHVYLRALLGYSGFILCVHSRLLSLVPLLGLALCCHMLALLLLPESLSLKRKKITLHCRSDDSNVSLIVNVLFLLFNFTSCFSVIYSLPFGLFEFHLVPTMI